MMDTADKMTQLTARSMQPAVPSTAVAKLQSVEGKGEEAKQTEERKSAQQVAEQLKEISRDEVEQASSEISDFVQNIQRNLSFTVHVDTGKPIIKVTDSETDEVIRQIPTEEVLKLHQYIHDASGILFKAKV
jgi:flagellar protein FlaG